MGCGASAKKKGKYEKGKGEGKGEESTAAGEEGKKGKHGQEEPNGAGGESQGDDSHDDHHKKGGKKKKDKKGKGKGKGEPEAPLEPRIQDESSTMDLLSNVPLFKGLSRPELSKLAQASTEKKYKKGEVVIRQGEEGSEFFIIMSGEASVTLGDSESVSGCREVASITTGDHFGEKALLYDQPRSATITVTSDVPLDALVITRDDFMEKGLINKVHFAHRKAIGGAGARDLNHINKRHDKASKEIKDATTREFLSTAMKNNANIKAFFPLKDKQINEMINVCWREEVADGQTLIQEGDIDADFFYIIDKGIFEVSREDKSISSEVLADDEKREELALRSSVFVPDALTQAADPSGHHPETPNGNARCRVSVMMKNLTVGDSFGEMALFFLAPRSATITARADSAVWVFDRYNVKNILMKMSDQRCDDLVRLLRKVDILQSLMPEEERALARAMIEIHYTQGEVIMEQGDLGSTFFILIDGEVIVKEEGVEVRRMNASRENGTTQFFGERALLNDEPRSATIEVAGSAQVLAMDREMFTLVLGPLEDIIKENAEQTGEKRSHLRSASEMQEDTMAKVRSLYPPLPKQMVQSGTAPLTPRSAARQAIAAPLGAQASVAETVAPVEVDFVNMKRSELHKIGLLGCGGFGTVELYEHRETHACYALKGISKGYIVKSGSQKDVMNEKNILRMCSSNFIIQLHGTYNEPQMLYFLMEAALGGELYAVYNRKGLHGKEDHAKFYIASVTMALEHLHDLRVIYRDLKPENIMLKESGHAKLCDMGLAKYVVGCTHTTCGTSDYFAPEIVKQQAYTRAVDWWGLGILLFELMSGYPPFEGQSSTQTYQNIVVGIDKVKFPKKTQAPLVCSLIRPLLNPSPEERPPMRPGGVKNIMEHAWYGSEFDWKAFKALTMTPPYVPKVKSKHDLSNFDVHTDEKPPQLKYRDDHSGWDKDF